MEYKGYQIFAELKIIQEWALKEKDGEVALDYLIETCDFDTSNIINCWINKNGESIGENHIFNDVNDAKKYINELLDPKNAYCPNYPEDIILPNEEGVCSLCGRHGAQSQRFDD